MANMRAMIAIRAHRCALLLEKYPPDPVPGRNPAQKDLFVTALAQSANDWQYYQYVRHESDIGAPDVADLRIRKGTPVEMRFALSPSLRTSRPLTAAEFFDVMNSCTPEVYERAFGPFPDPLQPEDPDAEMSP